MIILCHWWSDHLYNRNRLPIVYSSHDQSDQRWLDNDLQIQKSTSINSECNKKWSTRHFTWKESCIHVLSFN
jgi:hypothetical protein